MAAPKGNKFASKEDSEKLSEALYVRMRIEEKEACKLAAGNTSVSDWARRTLLNSACIIKEPAEPTSQSSIVSDRCITFNVDMK